MHRARDIAPELGSYPGKGEALWKSLLVTGGDLLVFVDADLTQWGPHFVTGLVGPLLLGGPPGSGPPDPGGQVQLVKGFYERVRTERDGSTSTEGGRVTELVARPLLSLWWPQLAGVVQPLAGEWAARRSLMEVTGPSRSGMAWSCPRCWTPSPGTAPVPWPRWTWAPGPIVTRPTTTWP